MRLSLSSCSARSLIAYVLGHHCLTEDEMRGLGINDSLALQFMRLKKQFRARSAWLDCNFISIGYNCLPYSCLVRWGLAPTIAQQDWGGGGET